MAQTVLKLLSAIGAMLLLSMALALAGNYDSQYFWCVFVDVCG